MKNSYFFSHLNENNNKAGKVEKLSEEEEKKNENRIKLIQRNKARTSNKS